MHTLSVGPLLAVVPGNCTQTKYLRIAYDTPCYSTIWEVYNSAEVQFSAAHVGAPSGISD
jgi:hypothetical protein